MPFYRTIHHFILPTLHEVCELFTFIVRLIQKWKIQQPFDRAIASAYIYMYNTNG